jgi:hypothetical protein
MYSRRMIIHLVFITGMVSFGCNSDNQAGRASSEGMNLVPGIDFALQ